MRARYAMRRLMGVYRSEEGVALVTGILVSAIVLTLSISAVAISIHNTDASGYDRRRLMAVNAAESGIDFYYARLATTGFANLANQGTLPAGHTVSQDGFCSVTGTTSTTPSSTFVVTPTFYVPNSPTQYRCDEYATFASGANANGPWYVELTSVGTAMGQSTPQRIMTSRARLSRGRSGLVFPSAAILGNSQVSLSSQLTLKGYGANNADVYVNGNLSVSTASRIEGNMYVQGNATVANGNFRATGDVWAKSWLKISGGTIEGQAISSTSTTTACPGGSNPANASICVSGNTNVYGGAKAVGEISVKTPAYVKAPLNRYTSGIGDPPTISYPTYTFTAGDWSDPPYVTKNSCADVITEINNWTTGNKYIRLTGSSGTNCTLSISSPKTLPGNLAVLTDGGITMPSNTHLRSAMSTAPTVYFFTGLSTLNDPAQASCTSAGHFVAQSNTSVAPDLTITPTPPSPKLVVFTPNSCTTTFASNALNDAHGQVFSGTVTFASNQLFWYTPISLPEETAAQAAGYLVDPVYRREAATS
jgi:hypothetical protein